MDTVKLYQQDVYLRSCESCILSIQEDTVLLDQTVFFPVGGGQSCDLGTIDGIQVTDVYEQDNLVYHRVVSARSLSPGQKVTCTIDWERRFDNMQRHCGEHILSGICFREFGGVNRGFHMGQDYMTVDISLEQNPAVREITWEMAKHAELCTNEVIWSNAPVTVRRFESRKEAEKMPLRKPLAIDEEISIVCVGDVNNAADCVACCGTHPATAGQVGLVKLYKVEHYKGMFRIYFEAGKRALLDYDKKHDLVAQLGTRFSAGTDDLADKIQLREDRAKAVKDELSALRRSLIEQRVNVIREDLATAEASSETFPFLIYEYHDMKTDDLLNLGKPVMKAVGGLLAILSVSDNTALLFSNGDTDCGHLVKEYAPAYQGRGGGKAVSARAVFPDKKQLDSFISLLREKLC